MLPSGVVNLHLGGNNLATGSRDAPDTTPSTTADGTTLRRSIGLGQPTISISTDNRARCSRRWRRLPPWVHRYTSALRPVRTTAAVHGLLDQVQIYNRVWRGLRLPRWRRRRAFDHQHEPGHRRQGTAHHSDHRWRWIRAGGDGGSIRTSPGLPFAEDFSGHVLQRHAVDGYAAAGFDHESEHVAVPGVQLLSDRPGLQYRQPRR